MPARPVYLNCLHVRVAKGAIENSPVEYTGGSRVSILHRRTARDGLCGLLRLEPAGPNGFGMKEGRRYGDAASSGLTGIGGIECWL